VSVLRHRTGRFLLSVAALALGWQLFLGVTAPRRVDAAVAAQLDRAAHLDIAVTLGFAPEDFHIRIFQTHGIVSGVKGTTVLLNRVTPDNVRAISRYYWVQRIHAQRSPS
jgi:hypothetical protein